MNLDKNNPIPLYYQLAEQIREQIQTGQLEAGAQIPSERELSETFAISRMTVRQAIGYLVQQGVLMVKKGIGTFVAEPKLTYDALHLLGFTEEVIRQGGTATSKVLEQGVVVPPFSVITGLNLKAHETTVKIVRLRLSQNVPLLLETTYVPTALCPGLELENLATQSLYVILERQYELRLTRASQTFEATKANEYESNLFGIEPGTAMILLEGVTFDNQARPIEYFKALYRGDRFKYALESQRNGSLEIANATQVSVVLD